MGRYFWGVGKSAQIYPRNFQIVDFGGVNELSVFDKKGLEVILGSSFQYRFVRLSSRWRVCVTAMCDLVDCTANARSSALRK